MHKQAIMFLYFIWLLEANKFFEKWLQRWTGFYLQVILNIHLRVHTIVPIFDESLTIS